MSCSKRGHESSVGAKLHIASLFKNNRMKAQDKGRMMVYKCELCGLWHVGHMSIRHRGKGDYR